MNTSQASAQTGGFAVQGEGALVPPKTVKELIVAWQASGRQASQLRRKLKEVAQHAQRYRRDLVFLAQQNQLRKQQAEDLRARLLVVLERQQSTPEVDSETLTLAPDQESVPAQLVYNLLKRLRDSQSIMAEYDTLLQFRENQVQELLAAKASASADDQGNQGFLISQLRGQLSQARHRVRLLTQELSQAGSSQEGQERIRQLEELIAASGSGRDELAAKDRQLQQVVQQLTTLREGAQKLKTAYDASVKKVAELEARPLVAAALASSDSAELLEEMAALQDEVGRLQEDVSLLQKENEDLRVQSAAGPSPEVMQQLTAKLNELNGELEVERTRVAQLEAAGRELAALREENSALKANAGDSQRAEKLEAAVVDLRAKLQLAASKYQEVKQALLDKHRELNELKSKSQETEKKSEFLVPVVQTLEAALKEARQESEKSRAELAGEREKSAELQKRLAAAPGAAPAAASASVSGEGLAEMETKLKEARRSAVRAQAEAGVKRKEAAKLQEELTTLKTALASAEAKLKAAGIA